MSAASSLVRQRVSDAISLWRAGQRPDARGFIEQHPDVKSAQSLVIDLAYEEFCLRQEAGEQLDTEKFLANFPTVQHSLARMLDVHGALRSQAIKIDTQTAWPESGTRWLDWDLIEPLGRGAFSRVFLAREPALGNREVVVKCSFAGPHEAFILGSLSHPNIVPIHSTRHDESRGLTGISMPLLGRSTLADALNLLAAQGKTGRSADLFWLAENGSGSTKQAIQTTGVDYASAVMALIQHVASGLAAAHAAGVVHGDIKPSNVLLSFAGEPMLMDFNLSAGPGGDFERAGGTPPYMAPECLAGFWQDPLRPDVQGKLDPRSDLFSLGVVLLELLLGRIPFHFDLSRPESLPTEDSWQALAQRAVSQAREPKLQAVLDRCLAIDPKHRYSSAGELAGDLTEILESKERFRRWTRRLVLAAAASAAVSTAGLVWVATREDPRSAAALLRRAKEHIAKQEFQEAGLLLMRAQEGGRDPAIAAWIGYCLAHTTNYYSAHSYFLEALKHSDHADLRNNLGYCCGKLSKFADAREQFGRALVLDSLLQAAFHNRANLLLDHAASNSFDLPDASWKDFKSAADLGPKNGELSVDSAKAIAYAHYRKQPIDGDLPEQIVLALVAGIDRDVFRTSRFAHEHFNLDELANRAKGFQGPAIPLSVPLILPPRILLPDR